MLPAIMSTSQLVTTFRYYYYVSGLVSLFCFSLGNSLYTGNTEDTDTEKLKAEAFPYRAHRGPSVA